MSCAPRSMRSSVSPSAGKLYISSSERQYPIGRPNNLPLHCGQCAADNPTLSPIVSIEVSKHISPESGLLSSRQFGPAPALNPTFAHSLNPFGNRIVEGWPETLGA